MVATWCFQVMSRNGLDDEVIARYQNLYDNYISIIVVNGIKGRRIKNTRQSVRQGDKFSMAIFAFGMDPNLTYLDTPLKCILINTQVTQGPMTQTALQPTPRPEPPPALPGLPELPPQPPEFQPPARQQRGPPDIETRYVLYAYCDDLKPAITSRWEFLLVERVMTLFELASGCKMHRSAESQKCKFLQLGRWKTELTQEMIPHQFFSLSDHLDFLGLTHKATYTLTRRVNGVALKDRIQKVIGPWGGGRFMSLNMQPHSVNNYAFSKLLYKCNPIHPRVEDENFFSMTAKSFIYADLLEKPNKHVLHREIKDGGLGLICISSRAKAALITTFLLTAINPNFIRNSYLNLLYRHFVLEKQTPPMIRPPYFGEGFFETIRRLKSSIPSIELISIKGVYDFLVSSTLRAEIEIPGTQGSSNPADWPLIPLTCKERNPETN